MYNARQAYKICYQKYEDKQEVANVLEPHYQLRHKPRHVRNQQNNN